MLIKHVSFMAMDSLNMCIAVTERRQQHMIDLL